MLLDVGGLLSKYRYPSVGSCCTGDRGVSGWVGGWVVGWELVDEVSCPNMGRLSGVGGF